MVSSMKKNPYALISLPFFLIGLLLAGQALWRYQQALASRAWPVVDGSVTWASVAEKKSIDGGVRFTPRVEFRYTVGGDVYESDTYSFASKSTTDGGLAQGLISIYADHPEVDVYVKPGNPRRAVLRPGDTHGLLKDGSLGGVFVAIGLYALWRGRGWRRYG